MGNWTCEKCKFGTADYIHRCSFCGAPKPVVPVKDQIQEKVESHLLQSIHQTVNELHPTKADRVWRWMESTLQAKNKLDGDIKNSIHSVVDQLHPHDAKKTWRWMEDNVL